MATKTTTDEKVKQLFDLVQEKKLAIEKAERPCWKTEEWKDDFQTRVNQISVQEKRKELAELESRLNAIISPELKAQMELEAIEKLLSSK